MAKTDAIATKQEDALATVPAGGLAPAPSRYQKDDKRGLEGTTQADVSIPRLALAQALNPQVTEGDPHRIEGLKVGDLFNSVTGQAYGREVFVQILRRMPLRAMEFNDIDDGGGVKDPNVPLDDPRCQWHGDEKPVATVFRDFLARLLPSGELIAISFKSSGIKVAKTLWGLVVMRNKPVWEGRYRITTGVELKPKPHQIYKAENADWVSDADSAIGEQMYESVQNITSEAIERKAEREPGDEDFPAVPTPSEM